MVINAILSEYAECLVLHQWLQVNRIPHAHLANESQLSGRMGAIRGSRLKAIGQSKGFPDYIVLVKPYMLFIEMKRCKGGTVSQEQRQWLEQLNGVGANVVAAVCYGADAATGLVDLLRSSVKPYDHVLKCAMGEGGLVTVEPLAKK